jgi:transcriptional regulator with XRE-family HTH domain
MKDKNAIAKLRERAGLTQFELAGEIGVSENTIANWEKGGAAKWIDHLSSLCNVLGCDLRDLRDESESRIDSWTLTPEILARVHDYCMSRANKGTKRAASRLASFATLYDKPLRYWLDKADRLIAQCNSSNPQCHEIDYQIIADLLVIQNFVSGLDRLQRPQSNGYEPLNIEAFSRLVEQAKFSREFISRFINFDEQRFSRRLIFQTRGLSIYVIGWFPGQQVGMHHHGSSLDAIQVIQGEMTHGVLSREDCKREGIPFEGNPRAKLDRKTKNKVFYENELVLIDGYHAHQIANLSDKPLVTLHFRVGLPPDDDHWQQKESQAVLLQYLSSLALTV